ncbi:EAL domain-containing protein [Sphingomonas sp.]|uniref:putative bifunctional diguanylate cyclase/phosphodiesterase n=1 Tax=Sphingomonas sp. TaxID=28214 RepID=UPI002EDB713E
MRWRNLTFLRPPGVLVPLAALAVAGLAGRGVEGAFAAVALVLAAWGSTMLHDRAIRSALRRIETLHPSAAAGSVLARLSEGIDRIEEATAACAERAQQRHPVSGLPTREPLLARMADDGEGMLGGVAFADYDRLSAFDPTLANRVLLALVARITRMVSADRLVAHVDRGHLAIWFGPETPADAATAAMCAIGYALGDVFTDDTREIVPEVVVRQVRHERDADSPQVSLFRVLAAFSLPEGASAAVAAIDPVAVARERFTLEQDLRQAIAQQQFSLDFQPLIDSREGRVIGAEALIRWSHPVHGRVPPACFIPIMEAGGLADEIGLWALNAAVREAKGWAQAGLGPLTVAVNVSGHQLEDEALPVMVARTLERHALAPTVLEIELTESVAMADGERAARLFERLRALGVRIAIDDFGTGYSSFSSLRQLTFDKIKIDREFVTSVDTRRDSQAICQSILALGRGLGIRVLAEGVERPEELAWLRRHGCDHFQGYWFSPPLPAADFAAFVRDTATLADRLAPSSVQRLLA